MTEEWRKLLDKTPGKGDDNTKTTEILESVFKKLINFTGLESRSLKTCKAKSE